MMEQMSKKRIPDGWEVKPLNQILSLFGRIGFRGYNVTDLVQEGKGAITLSPSNIENGIVTFNKCTYLSWEKYKESPEIMVEEGDILLVKTGSTYGKIGYVESLPWPSTINPQYVVLKKFNCNSRLLAYLLEQKEFQDQIESITSGGAIPTMSQAKIYNCTVTLPSDKDEQSRIATALSDVDELIETLKKLIEKKRNIKQGAMQELLSGKRRLQGFTDKWVETKVGSVTGKISRGQTLTSDEFQFGNVPVMAGGKQYAGFHNVANHKGRTITISGSGASAGYIYLHNSPIFATDCSVIVESNTFSLDFLYYLLSFKQEELYKLQTGGAQPHVYPRDIEAIEIFIPENKDEQARISKILFDMDSEISMLESRLTKYQFLKQGMMQQLLTGKIRLI